VPPAPAGLDGTRQAISPSTRRGSRLVARICTPGHARSNASVSYALPAI